MKICYAGGGTAGHILPAIAVSQVLRKQVQPLQEFWICTADEHEQRMIAEHGIRTCPIPTGKLRRYASWRNFTDLFRIAGGVFSSVSILRKERPDVLFSKGGFASVPPVMAAALLGIPVVTHESDTSAGLATRLNFRRALTTCLSCQEAVSTLPAPRKGHKVVVTGNPVRSDLASCDARVGRKMLGLDADTPLLLVLGGSQGSAHINELVWENLEELCSLCYVFHQAGAVGWKEIEHERYCCVPFVQQGLGDLMAASTLVVSRAGAGAISELTLLGKPMLLLPLGTHASRGDQVLNAHVLQERGAAEVLLRDSADAHAFMSRIRSLLGSPQRLAAMAQASARMGRPDAAQAIAGEVLAVARERDAQKG